MSQLSLLRNHLGLKHRLLSSLLASSEAPLGHVFGFHQNFSWGLVLGRPISCELEARFLLLLLWLHLKIVTEILHPLPRGSPVLQVDVGLDLHRGLCLPGHITMFRLLSK